jgi:hypothetical protein
MTHKIIKTNNYLLVVDDSEIKRGYWFYLDDAVVVARYNESKPVNSARKIIAHLPLNGSPILEGVDLLPPYSRHQEDGLDKKSVDFVREIGGTEQQRLAFKDGYLEAKEKYKYTEEDIRNAFNAGLMNRYSRTGEAVAEEEFIQSLHQYPTEFESVMEYNIYTETYTPKTITTTQGIQWVGEYK